jgi:hypothetical protein
MKNLLKYRQAGALLLGASLLSGCESAQPRPVASRPMPTTVTLSPKAPPSPRPTVVTAKVETPVQQEKPAEPQSLAITNPAPEVHPARFEDGDPSASLHPAMPARKSYVDITARSCFGHSDDYSWISGELQYSHLSKAWRLRYASVDEVDKYGGSMTLVCDRPSTEFKDGVCVRIRGHVDDMSGRSTAPPYQVESVQIIEKPDEKGN